MASGRNETESGDVAGRGCMSECKRTVDVCVGNVGDAVRNVGVGLGSHTDKCMGQS